MPSLPSSQRVLSELGILTILHAPRDLHLLFLTRFLRMLAYGSAALILALHFAALGISDERIGLFMTLTLLGDVAVSLLLTLVADALGRRRILLLGSACMAFSGACFGIFGNYWVLLFAAVVGVISPSGNEIGPFRAVEESTLAQLVEQEARSDVFAWYVVIGTLGSAAGLAGGGWLVEGVKAAHGWSDVKAYRLLFWLYGAIGVLKAAITLLLSPRCEAQPAGAKHTAQEEAEEEERGEFLLDDDNEEDDEGRASTDAQQQQQQRRRRQRQPKPAPSPPPKPKMGFAQLSTKTRWTLLKLCALFFVDSLASGMVPYSLINFYMDRKFGMPKSILGTIMSVTWFCSSVGNIFASAIAKRIGLIRTMVFTHLPSAIFLALIPAPQVLWLTVVFLVGRGTLSSMDQAPRSAFLSAVVLPEERTAVMGIVNTVKTLSQSGGPTITGVLAGKSHFWIAFLAAGAMKAGYDLGLLTFFLKTDVSGRKPEGAVRLPGGGRGRDSEESLGSLANEFELQSASEDEGYADDDDDDEGRGGRHGGPGKRRDSAEVQLK